jgi:type IV pilus assembly protein PilC
MSIAFAYQVRDYRGNVIDGTLDAKDADDASQQLRREGYQVLELKTAEQDGPGLFARSVTRSDIVYMTNQLAVMVDTGITLAAALEGMAAQEQNPRLKKVLLELKSGVEEGEDFSKALAKHPKLFDKTYISLIKASEATGTLGPMLDRVATYLRKEIETRGKVKAAMAYPCVMLGLAVGVTIFLLTYIMPQFMPMFSSKGVKLPMATKVMMVISDAMIHYWYAWLVGLVAVVGGLLYGKRTEPGRKLWDRIKINLPLIGPMTRKVVISRSVRTLGTMISSGIPMLDALQLTSEVSGNFYYEELWKMVSDKVVSGSQICEALAGSPLFPAMLIQMFSAGEQTGRLGPVLERVSNYFDSEVETSLKAVTSVIEPILISVMGVVVGTIGMALLLPIFSLSGAQH